ncbi:hypothetical protein [Streptomyces sp. NPDC000880]
MSVSLTKSSARAALASAHVHRDRASLRALRTELQAIAHDSNTEFGTAWSLYDAALALALTRAYTGNRRATASIAVALSQADDALTAHERDTAPRP